MTKLALAAIAAYGCGVAPVSHPEPVAAQAAQFAADGKLAPPTDYRHWTFLTSGLGMTYGPLAAAANSAPNFDSVFVDPQSYDQFVATGAWREGAIFAVEVRASEHTGSIVHGGNFQTDLAGLEVAVKDGKRFAKGWGYFSFDAALETPAEVKPPDAACYACHGKNAAVENTFTQFYPTLFAVAKAKRTVRADFVGIPPSSNDLYATILAHGDAHALLDRTAATWPEAALVREPALNAVAYRLLAAHHADAALALFREVTVRFPASANAWDSLGEALEAAHQLDAARDATARGLAVVTAEQAAIGESLHARAARLAP
jgi:tetratricopeptide (TPR) repeat protein